jgi:hypothetical protein
MAFTTFATPLAEARGLLNDPDGAIYVNTLMITLGAKVYRELQTKLSSMNIGTVKEFNSTPIEVAAGTTALIAGAGLPADLLFPIELKERADGATFWPSEPNMEQRDWEPNVPLVTELRYWAWREDEIKFPGATSAREVQIRYSKSLGTISATSSQIQILNCESWFAQRLAVVAAITLSNPTRGAALAGDLEGLWDDFVRTMIKRKQSIPVRRRRTRYRRP